MDFSNISSFLKDTGEKISLVVKGNSKEKKEVEAPTLPDTAKDMYGEADDVDVPEEKGEVSEEKPKEEKESKEESPPKELPNLDIPSEKKEEKKPKKPKKGHEIVEHSSEEVPEMEDEIREFEDSIQQVYSGGLLDSGRDGESSYSEPKASEHGFFSEFHQFLEGNDLPDVASDLLDVDLVEKMKEYHAHKEEGKPYYFHEGELRKALKENLMRLKSLEREWFAHKERLAREEKMLMKKEEQISEATEEVKYLLEEMKSKDDFTRELPEEDWFNLSNGHRLKSLSDLRSSLRVMDSGTFGHHVQGRRNDFAAWIRGAFGKEALADRIAGCSSREEMLKVLANAESPE